MIRHGSVAVPGERGPELLTTPQGSTADIFDIVEWLAARHPEIYLVDLDGIQRGEPQLDYLQEMSRDAEFWVDAGVRGADATIDVIVAGARRAVLSTSHLGGPGELRRAWALTTDLMFEIELRHGQLVAPPPVWGAIDAVALAASVRQIGVTQVVLGFREEPPDWSLVAQVAQQGPTWVAGTFEPGDHARLLASGAAGGIYHILEELSEMWREPNPS